MQLCPFFKNVVEWQELSVLQLHFVAVQHATYCNIRPGHSILRALNGARQASHRGLPQGLDGGIQKARNCLGHGKGPLRRRNAALLTKSEEAMQRKASLVSVHKAQREGFVRILSFRHPEMHAAAVVPPLLLKVQLHCIEMEASSENTRCGGSPPFRAKKLPKGAPASREPCAWRHGASLLLKWHLRKSARDRTGRRDQCSLAFQTENEDIDQNSPFPWVSSPAKCAAATLSDSASPM